MAAPASEKYDLKRAHRALYAPSARDFTIVEVPPMRYLAIDGHGDPNTSRDYAAALEALFGVAHTLKFRSKKELGRDFVVAPLEALWRADDPVVFATGEKSAWSWTALIAQPEWIDEPLVADAVAAVRAKGENPALELLRLHELHEGTSAQILHVGSYDDEAPTLARLHHEWMPQHGLTFNGAHHEIYLNDARRTAPEKLRTVLRQPVRPA
ncbi:GyrI-like domain-containing protein [Agromyces sp. Marseille-P2726]|uniref:GyrI-like domain-containing protein n=1 Tax=Agromyces sp. Marseille-P2726 TaxID=2709132 RepID=UPI00156EB7C2|nr:GyrI-like domain-containing protein [Agromyces sp. Marseille-P2726]